MEWLIRVLFKRRVKVEGIRVNNNGHWEPIPYYYRYIWRWQENDYNEVNA